MYAVINSIEVFSHIYLKRRMIVSIFSQKEASCIKFTNMAWHFILNLAMRQKNGKSCRYHDKPCDKYGTRNKSVTLKISLKT